MSADTVPMFSLEGKNALVTGASGGVGRATCALLAEEKASLVIASNDAEGLAAQEKELVARGVQVLAKVLDVTDEPHVAALFEEAGERFGTLDALLNLAGWQWLRRLVDGTSR